MFRYRDNSAVAAAVVVVVVVAAVAAVTAVEGFGAAFAVSAGSFHDHNMANISSDRSANTLGDGGVEVSEVTSRKQCNDEKLS